jgi:phage shock protein A
MSTFPGDMSIGWGFGLEPQEEGESLYEPPFNPERLLAEAAYYDEVAQKQPTDPLLAVSELEQRVEQLEARNTDDYALALGGRVNLLEAEVQRQGQAITDLEERLRSLTLVVNSLVERDEEFREVQNMIGAIYSALNAEGALSEKEGETN